MKFSIVIPTYNRCDELLKPCIESIIAHIDLSNVEVIVVANGCTDNTAEYMSTLPSCFKTIVDPNQLGYTIATNLGMKAATGDYVVLLNNDTIILDHGFNKWLEQLVQPFEADPKVGLSGPLMLHDNYADRDVLIFCCVMIGRAVINRIGYLDEIYSPGGGEDIDYSARAEDAGYKCVRVPANADPNTPNVGNFPLYHKENQTLKHNPDYSKVIMKKNGWLNAKRYNKHIRLDLGCGGISHPGYLGVDQYDYRAHIICDVTKLDFVEENSVEEILASHLFEHLNPYHAMDTLKGWLKVLKPGGRLVMEMPDILALCQAFVSEQDTMKRTGLLNCFYGSVNTSGVGGPDNITSPHLFGWWPQTTSDHMMGAGFTDVVVSSEQIKHPGYNFRIEGRKPTVATVKPAVTNGRQTVTATISTKDRYHTTLPLAIQSVAMQTVCPQELIIFDDGEQKDLRTDKTYEHLLRLLDSRGIKWRLMPGQRRGQVANHQAALSLATTDLIWRLDDDVIAEPNCLELLLSSITDGVGAVGGLVLSPNQSGTAPPAEYFSSQLADIDSKYNVQWNRNAGEADIEVDHLHCSFLFRRQLGTQVGYPSNLSPVGHREETIFTHSIKRQGYRLLVNPTAITWHLRNPDGGIRSTHQKEHYEHDDRIFAQFLGLPVVPRNDSKTIVLNNGIGDHYAFRELLPEVKAKYPKLKLAVCYPEVFQHDGIELISIADAMASGEDIEKQNVYAFCVQHNWSKHLTDAFRAIHLN